MDDHALGPLGTVTQVDDGWELRFERRYPHPVEAVWSAITDPAETPGWWGRLEEVDLRDGGRYVMAWENEGGPTMTARITAVDPPRLLEMVGDIHGRLRWELTPDGDSTRLVFRSTVPTEPDDEHLGMHVGWAENLAGWHWHLAALADALDGRPQALTMDDWQAFRDRYAAIGSR
jgi:uncharacterized protein YndB with AHSA1/START domain